MSIDLVIEQLELWSEDLNEKIERIEESCGNHSHIRNIEKEVLTMYQNILDSAIYYLDNPKEI
jgi:hypothetical protein